MSGHGVPWPVRRGLYRNSIWWENGRSKSKRHRDLLVSRKVVDICVLKNALLSGKENPELVEDGFCSYLLYSDYHFLPYIPKGLCWEVYSPLFSSHLTWDLNRMIIACSQSPLSPTPHHFRQYFELILLCVWLPWLSKNPLTATNR